MTEGAEESATNLWTASRYYVADQLLSQLSQNKPERSIKNISDASDAFQNYLQKRLKSVLDYRQSDRAVVLLSGGIDSICVAAALTKILPAKSVTALTVVTSPIEGSSTNTDLTRSSAVASHLGIPHHVVDLKVDQVVNLATKAADLLPTRELWEISAAAMILAVYNELDRLSIESSSVFTGGGADVLFAGGDRPPVNLTENDMCLWLDSNVSLRVNSSFKRNRLVPDFYELLLKERQDTYIETFQTMPAWELSGRLHPYSLFTERNGVSYDKAGLRQAAVDLGVPKEYAWTSKSPMQVSSGVVGSLAYAARMQVAEYPHAKTYTDPLVEPSENVLARYFLQTL